MLDRLLWFLAGLVAGGVVTVRALRRRPSPQDLKSAVAQTGADLLDLAARLIRPERRTGQSMGRSAKQVIRDGQIITDGQGITDRL